MQNPAAYKQAAIDWLLTHGTCDDRTTSTRLALADLSVRGVDYDASTLPDFGRVALDPGDSFNEATWGEAFTATVYPLDRDPKDWRECYDFWVGEEDIKRMLVSQMITGVLAAAETGDSAWKDRADAREVERLTRCSGTGSQPSPSA